MPSLRIDNASKEKVFFLFGIDHQSNASYLPLVFFFYTHIYSYCTVKIHLPNKVFLTADQLMCQKQGIVIIFHCLLHLFSSSFFLSILILTLNSLLVHWLVRSVVSYLNNLSYFFAFQVRN